MTSAADCTVKLCKEQASIVTLLTYFKGISRHAKLFKLGPWVAESHINKLETPGLLRMTLFPCPSLEISIYSTSAREARLLESSTYDGHSHGFVLTHHQGPQKSVTALSSTSSSTFLAGTADGRVVSYSVGDGEATTVTGEGHSNLVSALASTSSGQTVSVGFDDKVREIEAAAFMCVICSIE